MLMHMGLTYGGDGAKHETYIFMPQFLEGFCRANLNVTAPTCLPCMQVCHTSHK